MRVLHLILFLYYSFSLSPSYHNLVLKFLFSFKNISYCYYNFSDSSSFDVVSTLHNQDHSIISKDNNSISNKQGRSISNKEGHSLKEGHSISSKEGHSISNGALEPGTYQRIIMKSVLTQGRTFFFH